MLQEESRIVFSFRQTL